MNLLSLLRSRFVKVLAQLVDDSTPLLDMIRPSQDPRFGDYQANCAMPLSKRLNVSSREVAQSIVDKLEIDDFCLPAEVAGPGFINLRLRDDWLIEQLRRCHRDQRLGIAATEHPRTYVIDYSAPNVAKPMHVGHIRSTVIGDALCRTLRFLGHRVISDNHVGDWGTQFGMIIHGYKHFLDEEAYRRQPVPELARLYRLVHRLCDYHDARARVEDARAQLRDLSEQLEAERSGTVPDDPNARKQRARTVRNLEAKVKEARELVEKLEATVREVEADPELKARAREHASIGEAVLEETAKLHAGDEENLRLWREFLPNCRDEIRRVYERLDVRFDHEYGESHYQDRLADVVSRFQRRKLAVESDGAICIFLDGFDTPMIIRKKDGAYLYATTDLATIEFRMETWDPDVILYVVDHRQSEHFEKLFAVARLGGFPDVELKHVRFGTVMGPDGKPYRTRSGDTVGLEGLLDGAVAKALRVVAENDDAKPSPELSEEERREIAYRIGHAAIKYFDLSHNREVDYKFDEDKMVAMQGNTATYIQYSYARVLSIFAKGEVDIERLRRESPPVRLVDSAERALALELLRLEEALEQMVADYRPNQLTAYLFELAQTFHKFFDRCPVLKAEDDGLRSSRLVLCDLTARTIKLGLNLLGIDVVQRM